VWFEGRRAACRPNQGPLGFDLLPFGSRVRPVGGQPPTQALRILFTEGRGVRLRGIIQNLKDLTDRNGGGLD
jgi:hypothetical protein